MLPLRTTSAGGRVTRSPLTTLTALLALGVTLAAFADQPTPSIALDLAPSLAKAGPVGSGGTPRRSRIAFAQTDTLGRTDIYTMNPDGTGVVRLTDNDFAFDREPAWSPDGRKVVFTSSRDGNPEIYVMNADGSSVVRLTNNSARDEQPAWSPDGTRIAFVSTRGADLSDIYVMNANGTNQRRLTADANGNDSPAWSPDGSAVYYTGGGEILRVNANGSGKVRIIDFLPEGAFAPAISPDGRTIAFRSNRGSVWVASTADPMNTAYSLVHMMGGPMDAPTWGPDSQTLVFTALLFGQTTDEIQLMKHNLEGGGTLLTSAASIAATNPAWSR